MRNKTILNIGETHNLLTIIEFHGNVKYKPAYKCQCACGNEKIAFAKDIKAGKCKSCGCLKSLVGLCHMAYPYRNYIGKRFDRLLVLEYDYMHTGRGAHLLCKCDCGNEKTIKASKLTTHQVKSCGCKLEEEKKNFTEKYRRKNDGK